MKRKIKRRKSKVQLSAMDLRKLSDAALRKYVKTGKVPVGFKMTMQGLQKL